MAKKLIFLEKLDFGMSIPSNIITLVLGIYAFFLHVDPFIAKITGVILAALMLIKIGGLIAEWKNKVIRPIKKGERKEFEKISRTLPKSLFYRPNRGKQGRELRKIISSLEETRHLKKRPLLCVLYGDEEQAHNQFVECVAVDMVKQSYACESVKLKLLKSSFSDLRCFDELHDVILDSLIQLYPTENKKESIAQKMAESNQPIVLCADFYIQYCEHSESDEIIKNGFLEFWRDWPSVEDHSSHHRLFVFLFIYYRDKTRFQFKENKIKRNFLRTLEELRQSDNAILFNMFNVNCVVLPELSGVKESDAIKWLRTFQEHPTCENVSIPKVRDEIRQLYRKQAVKGRIPMEKLSEELRNIVLREKLGML